MWLPYVFAGLFFTASALAGSLWLLFQRSSRPWVLTFTSDGPLEGIVRLSGLFLGALALVVLAGAFSLPLFERATETVSLPIEVLGPDGHTVSVQVHAADGSRTDALYVKAYSIGYPYHLATLREYSEDKASIRVNDGDWVDVDNSTVNCVAPEAELRCVDGPMHTIRFRIPASALGAFRDGANMVHFRFNYAVSPSGQGDPSTGYRILDLEFESGTGADLIDGTTFTWDDPGTWSAPDGYGSSRDVSDGEALWEARDALVDGWNGEEIWASCADCHAKSGYDLQYFAFSNHSIVQRAKFHGLSESEGKKIAAYIRSIQIETYEGTTIDPPGRPWHPPYQPGPTQVASRAEEAPRTEGTPLSELDPIYWAAGAGLDWALDDDAVTKDYLFPNGILPSEMPVDGSLNQREIPVALQMPDWNEWLPVHHPIDVWGDAFRENRTWEAYLNRTPDNLWRAQNGDYQKLEDATKPIWAGLEEGRDNFKGRAVPAPYDWQVAELSRMQWALTKHFEILVPTHMEDKVQAFRGAQADRLQWPSDSRIVFDQAPHIGVKKSDGATTKGHDHDLMDRYSDTSWYHLQMVINSGATYSTGQKPIDWRYHFRHIPGIGSHPWRYATSYLKLLQNAETIAEDANTPFHDNTAEGWHMRHVSPLHIDAQHAWVRGLRPKLTDDEYRRLLNVVARMFVDGTSDNDPDQWARIENSDQGLDPADQTPTRYSGVIGQKTEYDRHWWTALENYGEAGVAYDLLEPLARWAEQAWPNGDWMALIAPYENNPAVDDRTAPEVQLTAPSEGPNLSATSSVTLEATADDPDGSVAGVTFFVDDTSVGSDTEPAYTTSWTPPSSGTYTLTATATDDEGHETRSSTVEVTVESDRDGAADSTGVIYSYYEGSWDQLPDFDALTPVDADTTDTVSLAPAQRADNFALRFRGFLKVPADTTYTFYVESDDGSALFIGGRRVVDNDGIHPAREASGALRLSKGYHPIRIEYFEAGGDEHLALRWESDSIEKAPVPSERLVPERPGGVVTQTLSLQEGWNLVSTSVAPTHPMMDQIFEALQSDLVVVKDETGRMYSPPYDLTALARWNAKEAYQVYLRSARSLSIKGTPLRTDAPIPLEQGWNFVPYLPSGSLPVEEAFAALGDRLVIVKDPTGAPYIPDPDFEVNEIGRVEPGEGYKVYVERADTLRYPTTTKTRVASSTRTAQARKNTGSRGVPTSATLIVETPELANGTVVQATVEDEVVARTSTRSGTAVLGIPGRSRFDEERVPRADPGDLISLTAGPDGEEALRVSSAESMIGRGSGQTLTYQPGKVVHLTTAQPEDVILEKNYPNPVRSTTTIAYTLPEERKVSLRIYNILGQEVATLVNGARSPGTHEVELDAAGLSSGVYFYRLEAGSHTQSRKLSIVQ